MGTAAERPCARRSGDANAEYQFQTLRRELAKAAFRTALTDEAPGLRPGRPVAVRRTQTVGVSDSSFFV